ncbi:MAG TPA: AAA family ATPase [Longimicrobiaceae bacterium]|nr:AAA family ATPase [Longimicrobiaceae bacterium]
MSGLEIRLLGGFSVIADDPVPGLNAGRLQSLLAYLLLQRGLPQQRQRLAFLFWPDTAEAQAHTNLRTLVHRLRRALPYPEQYLEVDGHALLWRADALYTLDVQDFEAAASEAASLPQLRQAIALYQGDLLPGCYDEWIEAERERLRQLFGRVLERAGGHLEAQRDYRGALEYAQQRVRHDPLDEAGYRQLMRLHALTGDRSGALRAYRRCVSTLAAELGVEPDPATREAYTHLLEMSAPDPASVPAERTADAGFSLVGREEEWRQLQRAWEIARAGTPQLAVLAGEAGIGKTRLAEEFAAWAERQGFRTAWGRAFAMEGGPAYSAIVPCVRAGLLRKVDPPLEPLWLTEIARILPELLIEHPGLDPPASITDAWQRSRLFEALARAVLAGGGPLLLVLDDLQWCESETLTWLQYLLRFDPRARLLVVAPLRSHEVDANHPLAALLLALRRTTQLTEVELDCLDAAQSARLAAEVSGSAGQPPSQAVYAGAEGNPLFIVEMVRYHLGREAAAGSVTDIASSEMEDVPLPPPVQAVISARLAQLTPVAHELVGCAAVIGRHFTLEMLASVSEVGEAQLAGGLDELCRRKIVAEQRGEHFDFTHEMLREVAYAELGSLRRRLLHRRVARALAASVSEPTRISSELAVHAERAGMTESAMRHHLAAARAAHHLGASGDAITSLRRALSLFEARTRTSSEERAIAVEVRELLGDLLYLTGRYPESRDTHERALREAPEPLRRARLYRKIGKALSGQHEYALALRVFRTAEGLLEAEPEDDPDRCREWLQIHLDRTSVLYWTGDWSEIEETHRKIGPHLEQYGTPQQRREHLQSILLMRLRRDRYVISEEMITLARRSVAESLEEGHVLTLAVVRFRLAFLLLFHEALKEAEEEATRVLELTQRTGDRSLAARCLTYLTVIHRMRGELAAVRTYAERSLHAATELEMADHVGAARANQVWLSWRQGDRAEARSHAGEALAVWAAMPTESAPFPFQWLALWPLLALALESGAARISKAVEYARQLLDLSQQRLPDVLTSPLEDAIQQWETGDAEAARTHLRQAVALAGETGYL